MCSSDLNNAVSRIAGMLAIAIPGIVVVSVTASNFGASAHLPSRDALLSGNSAGLDPRDALALTHAYARGFGSALFAGAALALAAAASALFLGDPRHSRGSSSPQGRPTH